MTVAIARVESVVPLFTLYVNESEPIYVSEVGEYVTVAVETFPTCTGVEIDPNDPCTGIPTMLKVKDSPFGSVPVKVSVTLEVPTNICALVDCAVGAEGIRYEKQLNNTICRNTFNFILLFLFTFFNSLQNLKVRKA